MLNGFGTIVNSLGKRVKPYLPQICGTILWRLNNKSAKVRQQAADLISRIAVVMKTCQVIIIMYQNKLIVHFFKWILSIIFNFVQKFNVKRQLCPTQHHLIFELEKTILALQIILFPPELEYRKNTFSDNNFEIPFVTEIGIPSSYKLLCNYVVW